MRRMNKPSADNAFALSAVTRRRTKVRRAARLVYSIKQYFIAYDDDLRRFWTVVSFQIKNTPCVIGLYAVCTFFTAPLNSVFKFAVVLWLGNGRREANENLRRFGKDGIFYDLFKTAD